MTRNDKQTLTNPKQVRYIGETSPLERTNGKVYAVISVERGWYRLRDDTSEDYLIPFRTI